MNNYIDRDRAVVWHPFTQMKTAGPPITIVRGKGALLFDDSGSEYIDAISSWWVNVHGHAHPHIAAKVSEQLATLEHVIFAGFTHPWAIELCERLLSIHPFQHQKVFFSDNGSTAVEVGLKMALQYWWNRNEPKKRIIAFEEAYHGDTLGAMSAGGRGTFTTPFDSIMFEVDHLPVPDGVNNNDVLSRFEAIACTNDVAAFIYEPVVQGAGGMRMYDVDGMNRILKLLKEHNVILIADEVMTGFGRTGKLFASEYYEVDPDIMALSKALTGGTMPLSVTTCKEFIHEAFVSSDKKKTFFHGHSYTGNPTACAAALASMDLIVHPDFMENIQRVNKRHITFSQTLERFDMVKNIRLRGTILAFEVETDSKDSYFNSIRDLLYDSFIAEKVILRPLGNTVYIMPPYIITDAQLDRVYQTIENALQQLNQ